MNVKRTILPVAVLGAAAAMLVPVEQTEGYSLLGFQLPTSQRDFRVFNNFTDPSANDNQVPHPNFPGYQGAVMAIWKGSVEWGSTAHGNGTGDPHQGTLGSGGANYDPTFQGRATGPGGLNDNIHSELSGGGGGTLAFTESPGSNGWRIRYYSSWTWNDGPGSSIPFNHIDLQGVACHEMGHAIGLGHTFVTGATMYPSISGTGVTARSIAQDDINGVRAAYGTANSGKCRINSVCISGNEIVITGQNFSASGNEVWFTQANAGGTGNPIKATSVTSDGTVIVTAIPAAAGPGDVLVKNNGFAGANLSNAWPTDLVDDGGGCSGLCPTPTNYCISAPNSTGTGMVMSYIGSSCASEENFTLTASDGPSNRNGIFYYGPNQTLNAFGDGFRCVGGSTFRLPIVTTDFFGDVEYTLDWTAPPVGSGPGAWEPGDTWNVQFWYRDPAAGGAGFNLSDGLEVEVGP